MFLHKGYNFREGIKKNKNVCGLSTPSYKTTYVQYTQNLGVDFCGRCPTPFKREGKGASRAAVYTQGNSQM